MSTQTNDSYPMPVSHRNRFPSETTPDGKYDRTRARQYWHDPQASVGHQPNDPYPVHVIDQNGNYVVACTITCAQASAPNINGMPNFSQPEMGPGGVILGGLGGTSQASINAGDLIRTPDLQTLTAKITADTGVAPKWSEQGPLTGAGEWRFLKTQSLQTAGELWNQQSLMGVGYPGKWSYTTLTGYSFQWADQSVFLPDPTVSFPLDPIPVPQDPLKPGEVLINSSVPMSTEKWIQIQGQQGGGGTGAGDGAQLTVIEAGITSLQADMARVKTRLGIF